MSEITILNREHPAVQYLCDKDKRLAKVISMVGEITYQSHEDGYAFLIHEIIEQMLSIKAGAKIYARLQELCGGEITAQAVAGLSYEEIKTRVKNRGYKLLSENYDRRIENIMVNDKVLIRKVKPDDIIEVNKKFLEFMNFQLTKENN